MTLTAARCDATNTRTGWDDWGTRGIPCQTTVGLRSFPDRAGVIRYHCSAPAHRRQVERMYGVLETVEPCRFCGRIEPILRGTYQRFVDPHESIFLACDSCVDHADLDDE